MILIVDDDGTDRLLLSRRLEKARPGIEVQAASDIDAAVAVMATKQPKMVLADMHLAKADGGDVIRLLRAHTDAPIIAMSGVTDPAMESAAREAGAAAWVLKESLDLDALLARLDG